VEAALNARIRVLAKKVPGINTDKKARFKLWRKRNVGALRNILKNIRKI